jgi:hypothetical protein
MWPSVPCALDERIRKVEAPDPHTGTGRMGQLVEVVAEATPC